jgi:hypothetical protein
VSRLRHTHCGQCGRKTPHYLLQSVNGGRPAHEYWRCGSCSFTVLTIANVADVEGLCDNLVAKLARTLVGDGRHDWDDARLFLREQAWIAYHDWDPTRAASFLAFASERLRLRLLDWIRRSTPDQFLYAPSLGGPGTVEGGDGSWHADTGDPLRVPVGRGAGHDHDDSLADLRRAVVQRGSGEPVDHRG